jgi:hypothetical protein
VQGIVWSKSLVNPNPGNRIIFYYLIPNPLVIKRHCILEYCPDLRASLDTRIIEVQYMLATLRLPSRPACRTKCFRAIPLVLHIFVLPFTILAHRYNRLKHGARTSPRTHHLYHVPDNIQSFSGLVEPSPRMCQCRTRTCWCRIVIRTCRWRIGTRTCQCKTVSRTCWCRIVIRTCRWRIGTRMCPCKTDSRTCWCRIVIRTCLWRQVEARRII